MSSTFTDVPSDSQDQRSRRRLSRLVQPLTIFVTLLAAALLLALYADERTVEIVEKLTRPHRVVRWTETELLLDNGAAVALPGLRVLPASSPILTSLLARGVEVRPDGRVIGLVDVWHWCGNDIVGRHIARVDVANALLYFRYGSIPEALVAHQVRDAKRAFGKYGWNVSDFGHFHYFESLLAEHRASSTLL